ncbi:hypothetical protein [Flavobacterium sp. MDT1-60]|uniref:hypothetical protein n=1 Tax=Flavobacterium sp. MDT1-60 TaxID=1979344 RepID=UPI00177E281C|nr:hypothetical protein [Flavobacterium sp. MDT1-60]QOG01084.1 hypothetical protein IHE43_14810 [Flavobacterium sp. MDT1-60]
MEFEEEKHNGKISPQKAQKMLNDEGMDVTLEEAAEILSFLKFMANAVVKKFLNEKEENS